MSEKPLICTAEEVRAFLRDAKTQHRVPVKPQPPLGEFGDSVYSTLCGPEWYEPTVVGRDGIEREGPPVFGVYSDDGEWGVKCPYAPGDRIWVKETWAEIDDEWGCPIIAWKAGGAKVIGANGERGRDWEQFIIHDSQPGNYEVDQWRPSTQMPRWAARIFRDITAVRVERLMDITAPGVVAEGHPFSSDLDQFKVSWNARHKKHPWASNPWVWVLELGRVT